MLACCVFELRDQKLTSLMNQSGGNGGMDASNGRGSDGHVSDGRGKGGTWCRM